MSSSASSLDIEALHEKPSSTTSETPITSTSKRRSILPKKLSNITFKPDPKVIYDAILGLSDGLTVPFALTAGLASVGSTKIVILGGLAELVAGAISMGLGGFIGSKSEAESYETTVRKCDDLITQSPLIVRDIICKHFQTLALSEKDSFRIADSLTSSEPDLKSFLLAHHFEASRPDTSRPYISAVTLGLSYFLGGFVALIPYLCVREDQVMLALWISIGIMAFVMFVFGYIKTAVVRGWRGKENVLAGIKGAVQMLIIGALAVGAAVGLVKAIESGNHF